MTKNFIIVFVSYLYYIMNKLLKFKNTNKRKLLYKKLDIIKLL